MANPVELGGSKNTSAGTGGSITVSPGAAVGDHVVVLIASSTGTTTGWSVADSQSNSYAADLGPTANGPHAVFAVFRARITTALVSGTDTITITVPSSIWAFAAIDISGLVTSPLDIHLAATGSGTAPASGTSGTTAQASEVAIGFVGVTSSSSLAESLSSPTAGYTSLTSQGGNQAAGSAWVFPYYQVLSATGTQSFGGTLSGSGSWYAAVLTYEVSSPANVTLGSIGLTTALPAMGPTGAAAETLGAVALSLAAPAVTAGASGAGSITLGSLTVTLAAQAAGAAGGAQATASGVALTFAEPAVAAGTSVAVTLGTAALALALPAATAVGGFTPGAASYRLIVPS